MMRLRSIFMLPVLLLVLIFLNQTIIQSGEDSNKEDYSKIAVHTIDSQDKSAMNENNYAGVPEIGTDKDAGIEKPNAPVILETRLKYGYFQKGKYIYYKKIKLENSDPKSFEILPYRDDVYCDVYAKDKNQAYWLYFVIEKADPITFDVLDILSHYAKDKNFVYYYDKPLLYVNPSTFEDLGFYAKDDRYIIKDGEILDFIDSKTFEIINSRFARDKNHVFKLLDGRPTLVLKDAKNKNKENDE